MPRKLKVHNVRDDTSEPEDESQDSSSWIGCVKANGKRIDALLTVNGESVKFELDSGAETNTIQKCHVGKTEIRPTQRRLIAWNGDRVNAVGETTLVVNNPVTDTSYSVDFIVNKNGYTNLRCICYST